MIHSKLYKSIVYILSWDTFSAFCANLVRAIEGLTALYRVHRCKLYWVLQKRGKREVSSQ